MKIFPNKVVIQVTFVWEPSHWIGKTSCPTLGEDLDHVIWWKRSLISSILQGQGSSFEENDGHYHRNISNATLFLYLSCISATCNNPLSILSPIGTPPSAAHLSNTISSRLPNIAPYLTYPLDTSTSIGSLPTVDGLDVHIAWYSEQKNQINYVKGKKPKARRWNY